MNRKLLFLLAFIAIALIVAYRLGGWEFDWRLFFSSFREMQPGWLILGVIASLSTYWLRAFRWQELLAPIRMIRLHPLVTSTLIGFSAIYILGRAGEFMRPVWLARREQVPVTSAVATIIVERFLDSLMLILAFAWALLVVDLPEGGNSEIMGTMENVAWVILLVSIGAIVAMFYFRANIDVIVEWIPVPRLASLLHNFAQGLSFLQRGRSFGLVMLHSLVLWVVVMLQFWFLMLGMNFDYTLSAATFVMVVAGIGSIFQIPGIGGGFQAAFVFCLTTFFGVQAERATAASLIAWALTYFPTIGVAAIYMLATGVSFKDLRVQPASELNSKL